MPAPLPVTLDQLKAHLNLSPNTSESDTELLLHLEAATEAVETRVGPLVAREFTEQVQGRNNTITVSKTPLLSVTSLIEAATGLAWGQVTFNVDPSGVITGALGRRLPRGTYTVTYTAGRHTDAFELPRRFQLAVLYVAEHLWEMQRGNAARPAMFGVAAQGPAGSASEAGFIYRGFALPRRALELLSGDEELGFA